jgi:hypothetical protein
MLTSRTRKLCLGTNPLRGHERFPFETPARRRRVLSAPTRIDQEYYWHFFPKNDDFNRGFGFDDNPDINVISKGFPKWESVNLKDMRKSSNPYKMWKGKSK